MTESHLVSPAEQGVSPLSPTLIRYGSEQEVIQKTIHTMDQGPLPLDYVQTLLSRAIYNQVQKELAILQKDEPEEDNPEEDVYKRIKEVLIQERTNGLTRLPWPTAAHTQEGVSTPYTYQNADEEFVFVRPGESRLFPEGFTRSIEEGLAFLAEKAVALLSPEDKAQAVEWLLTLQEKGFYFPYDNLFFEARTDKALMTPIIEYIYKHKDEYQFDPQGFLGGRAISSDEEEIPELIHKITFVDATNAIEHIALESNQEKQHALLSMFIDYNGYVSVLNTIRDLLNTRAYTPDEYQHIASVGKLLLGLPSDLPTQVFHTTLNSVYEAAADFPEYEPYQESQQKEIQLITKVITEYIQSSSIQNAVIGDIGTGFGRIPNALAVVSDIAPHIEKIIGFDNSDKNLDIAQVNYARLPDPKIPVEYQNGQWDTYSFAWTPQGYQWTSALKLEEASFDIACMTGRTAAHAEDQPRLKSLLKELNYGLKKGGLLICDFPNPSQGAYLENRRHVIQTLQKIGIPIEEFGGVEKVLEYSDIVVDSPDGKNFYNRHTPNIEFLRSIFHGCGFMIKEEIRAPITGQLWNGSENVYFVLEKIENKKHIL